RQELPQQPVQAPCSMRGQARACLSSQDSFPPPFNAQASHAAIACVNCRHMMSSSQVFSLDLETPMDPRRYGRFPFSPIINRPPLKWPGGARVALWIIPNIEIFHLDVRMPGDAQE